MQKANADLNSATKALEISYKSINEITPPQSGSMSELLASRALLSSGRVLIKHNQEWVGFAKNQVNQAKEKLKLDGITDSDLEPLSPPNYINLTKLAISMSDGIIQGSEKINPEIEQFIKDSNKPFLGYQPEETYIAAYNDFYDKMLD